MGLTEEQAKKVMGAIDGDFVTKARFNEVNEENKTLKTSVADRDKQLETLKASAGDNEELKKQIIDLQKQNADQKKAHEEEMTQLRLDNAIDAALTAAGAKNAKTVKALIDMTKVKLGEDGKLSGWDDQLKAVQKSDGYLFEAKQQGKDLILPGAKEYVIDDAELRRVKENYPLVWKNPDAKPKLCFVGCPHLSLQQLKGWTDALEEGLKAAGRKKLAVPTVFTTAPGVKKAFEATGYAARFAATGAILSCICPLMYMNNPLCGPMPVITCSNKLRTYTTARYYTEAEILDIITKGAAGK